MLSPSTIEDDEGCCAPSMYAQLAQCRKIMKALRVADTQESSGAAWTNSWDTKQVLSFSEIDVDRALH